MEQESQKRKLDETNHESQNTTILCAKNCGFFGSASTYNLCSKCYKDYLLKQSKNPDPRCSPIEEGKDKNKTNIEQIEANPVEVAVNNRDPATQVVVVVDEGASSGDPQKRATNRCSFCRKRIGLTGFKCRCGLTFCSLHRYSDKHNCLFDYKSAGQDAIAKANPVVKADKIEKI